jgi:hypothetical protein
MSLAAVFLAFNLKGGLAFPCDHVATELELCPWPPPPSSSPLGIFATKNTAKLILFV